MYSEFDSTERLLQLISADRIVASLRLSAHWLTFAREHAAGRGVGYRDVLYFHDGSCQWLFPHSNAGEQIEVFLFLADALADARLRDHARGYADDAIGDPVHGIYQGACREARGLPWYWNDIGSYSTIYGMRFPRALLLLKADTGDGRYETFARLCADAIVSRQQPSGLIDAGWSPANGWAEGGGRINSRIAYAMGMLAFMHQSTDELRYADALERMIVCFERLQNNDGSFCQSYRVDSAEPTDESVKNHFHGYILNGLTDAYEIVGDCRLLAMAEKLAAYTAARFYYRQLVPYCAGDSPNPSDQIELHSPVIDPALGLFKLYGITGVAHYLDMALKLWWHYFIWQADRPERAELHGAILQGCNPELPPPPDNVYAPYKAFYLPGRAGHCCIYYHNQYVLCSQRLLALLAARHRA